MSIFRYKALANGGKKISGVIDADSYDLAKEKLRREKILVTYLAPVESKKEILLPQALLLNFTRELGQLLNAGLPLYESLLTIEEKYKKHRVHPLFLDLCDQLKSGHQLSAALKKYPKSFDSIYLAMIQAGERTGSLPWVFDQLYQLVERKQKLKKQLLSAMAYPAFLGAFCFLMVIGLLLFVIPSMRDLFEGRQLHPLTQIVLSLSQFLQNSYQVILAFIIFALVSILYFSKKPKTKILFQKGIQKIPLMKTILTQAALIRFCRSVSILLYGGVPLISALQSGRRIMNHPLLEEVIENAEKHILEGKSLSEELRKSDQLPSLVPRMIAIAEETGKLPEMFQNISTIYDSQLERSLSHITTFLQPVLLLILGGIVGLVILSILLPLTDVSSLIST